MAGRNADHEMSHPAIAPQSGRQHLCPSSPRRRHVTAQPHHLVKSLVKYPGRIAFRLYSQHGLSFVGASVPATASSACRRDEGLWDCPKETLGGFSPGLFQELDARVVFLRLLL